MRFLIRRISRNILCLRLNSYEIIRIRAADFTVNGNCLRPTNRNRDRHLLLFRQHHDRGEMRSREGQDTILDLAVRVGRNRRAIAFQNAARELIAEPFFAHRNRDRGRIGIAAVCRRQLDIPSTGDLLAVQLFTDLGLFRLDSCQAGSRDRNTGRFVRNRCYIGRNIDRAVSLEAAGDKLVLVENNTLALHTLCHGAQRQANLLCNFLLRLCTGIVAPDAERCTGRIRNRAAHEGSVAEVRRIVIAAVEFVALAKDIVEVAVRIDHLMAACSKLRSSLRLVAAPAGRPEGNNDIRAKSPGRGIAVKIETVVECNRLHFGCLDERRDRIDIGNKLVVISIFHKLAKAHRAGGINVIRIFISADAEVRAALRREVFHILRQERLRECNCILISQINRRNGAVIGAARARQASRRRQDCVHMTRIVDQRNDRDALRGCIGNDGIHLGLRQFVLLGRIALPVVVSHIARVDRRSDIFAGIGLIAHSQAHIVQQEAHAVVADGKLQMGITRRRDLIDQGEDPILRKILASAVEVEDLHERRIRRLRLSRLHSLGRLLCGRFLSRRRENDERCEHRRDQQQREERFAQFSHQYFLLFLG